MGIIRRRGRRRYAGRAETGLRPYLLRPSRLYSSTSHGISIEPYRNGLTVSEPLSDATQAIALLCGVFGPDRAIKPLSQGEYTKLSAWLVSSNLHPEDLLKKEIADSVPITTGIETERLQNLLGRGVQLGFAVEEWQRNGIWVVSQSDTDYPARYIEHLEHKAPPLLFGVGNRELLCGGGVAIVGSRNVDYEGGEFTRVVAELCANNNMPVVSGGARGVDQFAATAALEASGVSINILADNLLKKSLERNARNAIADGRLLLISPFHPNAHFTVGTAMARNKLIYALADYGLIVSCDHMKGGTWSGAADELKRTNALPVFVRTGSNTPPGNSKLLKLGAVAWPENVSQDSLNQQLKELTPAKANTPSQQNLTLFDLPQKDQKQTS